MSAPIENLLARLEEDGFVVVPGRLSADALGSARQCADGLLAVVGWSDNAFDGHQTRRVYSLIGRLGELAPLVLDQLVHRLVAARLGEAYQLGMLFLTAVDPGERQQAPHFDAGIYPLERKLEAETNVIWALDDFILDNGATCVAPASHKWDPGRRPHPHELKAVEMAAGSVLVYSGNLWHAAGRNRTDHPRRALIFECVLPWLRPADNHLLTVPLEELMLLSPELRRLAGLVPASPYLGLVDGRHPDEWLQSLPASR